MRVRNSPKAETFMMMMIMMMMMTTTTTVMVMMMMKKLLAGIFSLIQSPIATAFSPRVIETASTPLVQI
jgi:hypothetical protein